MLYLPIYIIRNYNIYAANKIQVAISFIYKKNWNIYYKLSKKNIGKNINLFILNKKNMRLHILLIIFIYF